MTRLATRPGTSPDRDTATKSDLKSQNGAASILAYGTARSTISGAPLSPEELEQIDAYWRSMTLPFPEPGIRLIRLEHVEELNRQMAAYSAELQDAAADLEREFDALKAETARQLGLLFEPSDYPTTLLGYFAVHWDFPNLEPPSNLIWLSPSVHQLEEYRIHADSPVLKALQHTWEEQLRASFAQLPSFTAEDLEAPSFTAADLET